MAGFGAKKGEVRNPSGNNGRMQGYSTFKERAQHFRHMTKADVVAIVTNNEEMNKRSVLDVTVLKFIYNAVTAENNDNLNDFFDRLFGKPKQEIEQKIDVTTDKDRPVSAAVEWIEGVTRPIPPKRDNKTTVLN